MIKEKGHIIFSHLMETLRIRLGYIVDLDKYMSFVQAILNGDIPVDNYESFRIYSAFVFLQNESDRVEFYKVLDDILEEEFKTLIQAVEQLDEKEEEIKQEEIEEKTPDLEEETKIKKEEKEEKNDEEKVTSVHQEKIKKHIKKYLDLDEVIPTLSPDNTQGSSQIFIHSDEYFPVNRKQMIKNWRWIREKENTGFSGELDVPKTVKGIAKYDQFIQPFYLKGKKNKKSLLYIYNDVSGSMVPFESLGNRFLETAKLGGGLEETKAFYFNILPKNYVYQNSNISNPILLEQLLGSRRKKKTVGLIFSDAGAINGKISPKRINDSIDFFYRLLEFHAHVIWLNPMPKHRWENTSAEQISQAIKTMYPILDIEPAYMQSVIKSLMTKKKLD